MSGGQLDRQLMYTHVFLPFTVPGLKSINGCPGKLDLLARTTP